jgi:hypothetical protein
VHESDFLRHFKKTITINSLLDRSPTGNSISYTLRNSPQYWGYRRNCPEVVPCEGKAMDVQTAVFRDSRGIERTMEIISSTGNTKMLTPHRTQLVTLSGSRMVRDTRNDQRFTLNPDDTFEDEFGNTWVLKL